MRPPEAAPDVCRCKACRDSAADIAAGTVKWASVYGDHCANCGFFKSRSADWFWGQCLRFSLRPVDGGMKLLRVEGTKPAAGTLPWIVQANFSCGEFQPLHETAARDGRTR
jgi:hypothetical protein